MIDVNDPREVYEQRGRWEILDVREPYEWEAGHIEEAVHIPLGEVMPGVEGGRLDPERRVVVVCKTGNRSELDALMLQAPGVRRLQPGGWDRVVGDRRPPDRGLRGRPRPRRVTAPTISGPVHRRRPASLLKSAHRVGGPDLSDRGMALAGRGRGRG